jgi:alpha-mannosidase
MRYQELLILLPCHSLEDFPTYHEGDDAQSLLASWSALWHPVLLAAAGQAPAWRRIEDPPQELKDRLIVVPTVCVQKLPTGFTQRAKEAGATLIRKTTSRDEIVAAALEPLEGRPAVDDELAADFLALGYCYLQIQLLTRQMRYSSNLDEVFFSSTLLAAARGAITGDLALCREKLSACFSLLAEERDHYYPVDAFLVDLTMVASTTLGAPLAEDLARRVPTSVIVSADLVAEMASKHPGTLAALKAGLTRGDVGLIGGEATETRLPLVAHETILAELERGLAQYQQYLGARPEVFGRWRYGLTPHLPGILHRLGFSGALHTGFDEGKTPDGLQLKIGWEGLDGSAVGAIARTPLDASKPQTFLALAGKMGESMDSDHVATLCLAHWPGQASPWLDDLRRIGKYCAALGKFVTAPQYFRDTAAPGHLDRFEADRYRSPYLKQAIIRKQSDPLTTSVKYWRAETARQIAQTAGTLATLVTGQLPAEGVSPTGACTEAAAGDELVAAQTERAAAAGRRLASAIAPGKSTDAAGTLIINPHSFVRRIGVELAGLAGVPTVERPVYAADQHEGTSQVVVDVAGLGFVHVAPGKPAASDRKSILLVEENTLRNEFFEAIISPATGTLASLHEYKSRGNRLSQQLALRMPGPRQKPGDTYRDPDESAVYSVMAADSIETTIATTTLGEIRTRGQLLDSEGRRLAGFVQTYRLWRGSRVLHVEIELDPAEEPKADPWNSYFCARFAWPDEGAELYRTQHQTRTRATEKKFESPHYIEIEGAKASTTILTGGLAFHRRHELRMLDTLLISRHERARKFRLGIGVDLPHPLHEAIGLLAPPLVVPGVPRPTSGNSGWLMHLSSRNVISTHWEPLVREGRLAGFRARLLETAGRPVSIALSAFRTITSGARIDFAGNRLSDLIVEDGKLKLDLAAYEWVEIEAVW